MKFTTETIHQVEYRDLEQAIEERYGFPYSFVADVECSNDVSLEFTIFKDEYSPDYIKEIQEDIAEWKETQGNKQCWGPECFLFDMMNEGIIPEGKYIVRVYW